MSKKKIKTIKGLVGLLENISVQDIDQLKGYDKISNNKKETLSF